MQHIKVSRLSILPKFFRSTKSENVQLEDSQYIENLQVIAKIFEEKLPNYQFALSKISELSKPENMKIYYIGTKVKNHANGLKNIYDINGNKLVDLNDKEELTLFKHHPKHASIKGHRGIMIVLPTFLIKIPIIKDTTYDFYTYIRDVVIRKDR